MAESLDSAAPGDDGDRPGGVLIGVDLQKDLDTLLPAYDDPHGVTASFSLNLLNRVNRELDGDFDTHRFAHRALYNANAGRIEIYLESLSDQTVHILGQRFGFAKGERIHTENSHKYTVEGFQDLAKRGVSSPDFADALALTFVPARPTARAARAGSASSVRCRARTWELS